MSNPQTKPPSLRTRLIFIFALTVSLVGLSMGIGSTIVALQNGRSQIREQLEAIVTLKEIEIRSWLKTLNLDLRMELFRGDAPQLIPTVLEESPDTDAYRIAYDTQSRRFQETIALRPTFHELLLLNLEGEVIVASDPAREGERWDWLSYIQDGLEKPGVFVQTLSYSGVKADFNTIVAVYPVINDRWETIGVLVGRASVDTLNAVMLERTGMGDTGETYLVGRNRITLTPLRFPGYQSGQIRINTEAVNLALETRSDGFVRYKDYRGVPVVGVYHWVPELQLALLAKRDQSEAFRSIYTTVYLDLILTALAMLIVSLMAWLITHNLVQPITTLSKTARDIASGDLSQAAHITRDDEIGELANAFNAMTARLRDMLQREAERTKALEREISERQRVEKELRQSETRLQTLVDVAPFGALIYNLEADDNLILTATNHSANLILKTDCQQLIGKAIEDAFPGLRNTDIPDAYRRVAISGEKFYREQVAYDEAGIQGIYEVHAFQTGTKRVAVFFYDITERAQLLKQIQEQAQRIQQIIDTIPEGVLLLDTTAHVLQANPSGLSDLTTLATTKVGDRLSHLGDHPLTSLLNPPPKGLWHEITHEARVFQVLARTIETGPKPGNWVIVIRDVTRQRETEQRAQQQEQLAAVGQLAAGIAHDFNNIMATIMLYAQMTARADELSTRNRERIHIINQQAQHAADLIQQILDFSRRGVLERRPLDLLPLLKEHVKLLRRTLPETIRITLTAEPTEYIINADPTRIQQMLMNLAVNARDAMPNGGNFHITLSRADFDDPGHGPLVDMAPGNWARLSVADTGTGIPPDVLPHIFQPFFTTKPPGQGTGLGLSQVHGIVGVHNGHINVETVVGKGTTFVIYLPLQRIYTSITTQSKGKMLLARGRQQIILIVEDDATVRTALIEGLKALNYRTVEATNGHEALKILENQHHQIALILSDVVMPGMGGIALFHALQERQPDLPIILMSGHPLENQFEQLENLAGWLTKPPSLEKLSETLAQVLKQTKSPLR